MFRILVLIYRTLKLYEEGAISRVKNNKQKRVYKKYKNKKYQNTRMYTCNLNKQK